MFVYVYVKIAILSPLIIQRNAVVKERSHSLLFAFWSVIQPHGFSRVVVLPDVRVTVVCVRRVCVCVRRMLPTLDHGRFWGRWWWLGVWISRVGVVRGRGFVALTRHYSWLVFYRPFFEPFPHKNTRENNTTSNERIASFWSSRAHQ